MRLQPSQIVRDCIAVWRRGTATDEQLTAEIIGGLRRGGWHFVSDADLTSVEEPGDSICHDEWDLRLGANVQVDEEVLDHKRVIAGRVRKFARAEGLEWVERMKLGEHIAKQVGERLRLFPSERTATVAARP